MPPIILRFFDQDKVSRDYMGQCIIEFGDALKRNQLKVNSLEFAQPQWIEIKILKQKIGRVLVAFNYFDQDPKAQFPRYRFMMIFLVKSLHQLRDIS